MTVSALKAIVVKEKPDLVFFMERKNREKVVTKIQRRLKYPNSYITNPSRMAGGLALYWHSHITIHVECANNKNMMKLTCIYAPVNFLPTPYLGYALAIVITSATIG